MATILDGGEAIPVQPYRGAVQSPGVFTTTGRVSEEMGEALDRFHSQGELVLFTVPGILPSTGVGFWNVVAACPIRVVVAYYCHL